ncbi:MULTISPECIES: hypothetical protein [unclassified Aeromicrobium]|uniref:hypothetical protein n=1 Tax=unclassified Aeromicrobium TaxID=2633570 RepID=UPI00396B1DF4
MRARSAKVWPVIVLLRLWAVLVALVWLVPGFGLIDLFFSWNPDWPVMVEAGWGLFVSLGLALPLLVAAVRPASAQAALAQLSVAGAALLGAVVLGREAEAWWMLLLAAVSGLTVWAIARRQPSSSSSPVRLRALVPLALVAVPFALTYAWRMTTAGWDGPPADITNDVDHYVIQAALALAVPALALLATRSGSLRLSGTSAALMAGYSGLVSWAFPGTLAGWPAWISVGAMAWAAVVLAVTWWPANARIETSA